MQGRFSGRLGTKEDEKRLAAECRLVGPLLGGASRGEKSLHTLAKLVRAIAAGNVRAHLEAQEAERQVGAWVGSQPGGKRHGLCSIKHSRNLAAAAALLDSCMGAGSGAMLHDRLAASHSNLSAALPACL